MDCNEIILPSTDAKEIHDCLIEHLLHWQGLSQHYMSLGVYRWKIRPKHHDLEEVAKFCKRTRINPRCTACWQDESYLGQVKHVATKCHSTTALLRIFQRIILRLAQRITHDRAPEPAKWSIHCILPDPPGWSVFIPAKQLKGSPCNFWGSGWWFRTLGLFILWWNQKSIIHNSPHQTVAVCYQRWNCMKYVLLIFVVYLLLHSCNRSVEHHDSSLTYWKITVCRLCLASIVIYMLFLSCTKAGASTRRVPRQSNKSAPENYIPSSTSRDPWGRF